MKIWLFSIISISSKQQCKIALRWDMSQVTSYSIPFKIQADLNTMEMSSSQALNLTFQGKE